MNYTGLNHYFIRVIMYRTVALCNIMIPYHPGMQTYNHSSLILGACNCSSLEKQNTAVYSNASILPPSWNIGHPSIFNCHFTDFREGCLVHLPKMKQINFQNILGCLIFGYKILNASGPYISGQREYLWSKKKCWKTTKGIVKNTEDKFTLLFQDLVHFVRRSWKATLKRIYCELLNYMNQLSWTVVRSLVSLLRVSRAETVSGWCSPQIEVRINIAFLIRSSPTSYCPPRSINFALVSNTEAFRRASSCQR